MKILIDNNGISYYAAPTITVANDQLLEQANKFKFPLDAPPVDFPGIKASNVVLIRHGLSYFNYNI